MMILSKERKEARMATLQAAHERLSAKVKAEPKHPRVKDYKARIAEYEASMKNIEKHGAETV